MRVDEAMRVHACKPLDFECGAVAIARCIRGLRKLETSALCHVCGFQNTGELLDVSDYVR